MRSTSWCDTTVLPSGGCPDPQPHPISGTPPWFSLCREPQGPLWELCGDLRSRIARLSLTEVVPDRSPKFTSLPIMSNFSSGPAGTPGEEKVENRIWEASGCREWYHGGDRKPGAIKGGGKPRKARAGRTPAGPWLTSQTHLSLTSAQLPFSSGPGTWEADSTH